MKIGFIGLGNVGGKLAGSLLRNGFDVTVRDLDRAAAQLFLDQGAAWAESPKAMGPAPHPFVDRELEAQAMDIAEKNR